MKHRATELTRQRYDRIAPFYDALEWLMELRFRGWRRRIWSAVGAGRVLELGVGTGKNLEFHPPDADVTAIDLSPGMLARAKRRADRLGLSTPLIVADAQELPFADASFDIVVATFLFCSVPMPLRGLQEARRVLVPGGRLHLLEHVLSTKWPVRNLMRWLDPLPFHIWGAHIDRETVAIVRDAGFQIEREVDLSLDIVKHVVAKQPP